MRAIENQTHFQITSKGAYSHGLEEIYKVETIDLKSIRRMEIKEESSQKPLPVQKSTFPQLSLDLGPGFRGWMTPFLDKEPIQVLDLNKQLEKWLLENSYDTIGALRFADFSTELFVRKLGQGHREELSNKLHDYLKNKPVKETTVIDFLSLLKCVVGKIEKKKLYVALKPFGLDSWFSLTPMELADVKRLGKNEQRLWIDEVHQKLPRDILDDCFFKIAETWLIPWIEKRSGVATQEELFEYLLLRSSDSEVAEKVLSFFSYPLAKVLFYCRGDLFFSSLDNLNRFQKTEALLLTYFPTRYSRYRLDDLYRFVVAEMKEMLSELFFKNVLMHSGSFRILQDFVDISPSRK